MAVDDIYQVNTIYVQSDREWLNTFFYRVSVDDPALNGAAVALKMTQNWELQFFTARIGRLICNVVKIVAITAQKKWPVPDQDAVTEIPASGGNVFEEPMPAHTCAMFKQSSTTFGRSFQGRVYVSGMPRTFENSGGINTTGLTEYQTWGTEPFGKNSWTVATPSPLVVEHTNFSKKLATAGAPTPWADIENATIKPQLTTQRNRTATILTATTPIP